MAGILTSGQRMPASGGRDCRGLGEAVESRGAGPWGRWHSLVQGGSQDVFAIRRELHKGHRRVVVICNRQPG